MSELDLEQLRSQVWHLRNELAAIDARTERRIDEVEDKLIVRLDRAEHEILHMKTWVENQRTRHAKTPQWIFSIISAMGTIAAIWLGLKGAGLI